MGLAHCLKTWSGCLRRAPLSAALALSLCIAGAPSSAHAQTIETIYAGNNGGASLWTMYFNLTTTQPIRITSLDVNCGDAAGTPLTLDVYTTAVGGTYVGNQFNPGVWTQVSTGSGTTAGLNLHTTVDIADFNLTSAGTYGIAIRYTGGFPEYTNGTGANQTYSNGTVSLALGSSGSTTAGPFIGGLFDPRVWNGTISYQLISGLGACCRNNGTCTVIDLATCTSPSVGQNPGSTCSGAGNTCPTATSACCNTTTFACTFVAGSCPANTTSNGTICSPSPCNGACCNTNGTCTVGNLGNCTSPALPQGLGSTCGAGATCPVSTLACCNFVGVCVFANGSCPAGSNQVGAVCSPTPCATQPSLCEGAETSPVGGLPNAWTSTVVTGAGNPWAVVSGSFHTGANSISTNDVGSVSDQVLVMPAVTAGGNLTLDFWSSFSTEPTYDGWVVEFSTDGGATFTDVGQAAWILNGYNQAAISTQFQSPIAGQPAFSGAFTAWTERACTIPAVVGQQIIIRFRMCSDNSVAAVGVNIDDICVYNIQVGNGACCNSTTGACVTQSNTTCTGLFRGVGVACGAGGTCPGDVGRCCNNTTGSCAITAGSAGCGATGTYGGQGTTCTTACVSVSTCCDNATGTCNAIFGGSCTATQTAGTGASCGPNSCHSVAVCCNPATSACSAIFGGSCPAGMDLGSGTSCGPTSCQYGACCGGCSGCHVLPIASCNGAYQGNGTTCSGLCPNDGYTIGAAPAGVTFITATDDIGLYQDDAVQTISLPFNVSFYGTSYSSVNVCTNGNLQFTSNATAFGNVCLPTATLPGPAICPFWDDLYTVGGGAGGNGSGIFTSVTGVSPNQRFVIEWRGVYCCTAGAPTQDFEVIFYEGQNSFDFVYGTPMADRVSATIGVQAGGNATDPFTQFECNATGPNSGDSIRFSCGVSATNGACCNNTSGGCTSTTAGGCTAGSTFQGLGTTCAPNPCPQPPAGVCCRGSTCTTTITTAAACSASLIPGGTAGAILATAAACNTPGNTTNPCCYANYNKLNGITVQDIFDFLQDWFASSPYANTGGTGAPGNLAVQNIFDFLTAWFNGGC